MVGRAGISAPFSSIHVNTIKNFGSGRKNLIGNRVAYSAMTFEERSKLCHNPTAKKLFSLMEAKQTNLAVQIDVRSGKKLLHDAHLLGPHICVLKTHVDILDDFDKNFIAKLLELAEKHRFLIFEDRKFADIGAIVQKQYRGGMFSIASWADITNAHPLPGPGIVQGLKEVGLPLGRGLLLVAEMSSAGSLTKKAYLDAAANMAKEHADFVIGFISQRKLLDDPRWIHFTPGIKLTLGSDPLGQQYVTPKMAIAQRGCDVILVGRGITQAANPLSEAVRYREAGMQALQSRGKANAKER